MSSAIPVFFYHHINPHSGDTVTVTPEVFFAQMSFLSQEGFTTLSIDDLMITLRREHSVCNKTVVLTFDDGWLDNFLYAVPVLKKFRFNASFFLITGRVDAASHSGKRSLCDIPTHETAKAFIQKGEAARVVLDWDLVRSIEEDEHFRFYSHTVSHRRCAELPRAELLNELTESKLRIESELGRPCPYLCWPYGSFSDDAVKAAEDSGYTGIFTTIDGFCDAATDPSRITRIEAKNSVGWLQEFLEIA